MNEKNRTIIILILGLLSTVGPFSIDMYLPGFPAIAKSLKVPQEMLAYTLSSYFIGVSLGQLVWGPLLDRYGRKTITLVGLGVYVLATIACAFTDSLGMLVALRFVQALGACVGIVAPRAMIRDFFPVSENAKIFSLLILILGVSPIVAPTVGGYVISHLGWHAVFIILGAFAALVMAMVFFLLPESAGANLHYSLHPKAIMHKFADALRVRSFIVYSLIAGLSSAALFSYLSGSPFVFMQLYELNEQQYGYVFAIIAAGLIICSQLNNLLLRRYSSKQIIMVTITLQAGLGILMVAGTLFNLLNLYTTVLLIALFLSCQGFTFPNASALSMAPFSSNAGSASALMGAAQMGLAALASGVVGFLKPVNAMPMQATMLGCAGLACITFWAWGRNLNVNMED